MKKNQLIICSLICIGLLFSSRAISATNDFSYEKTKTITKSQPLRNSSKVSIKNSFGKVNINHWSQQEVKVVMTIIAKANTEALTQQVLDGITIDENIGEAISYETKINIHNNGMNKNNKKNGNNTSMEINYEIYLPEATPLKINNSFGNTNIPTRKGKTTVSQSFGDLTIGYLTNLDILKVEFGKLKALGMGNSDMDLQYSDINIENLDGMIKTNIDFCGKSKITLSKSIKDLVLKSSYSDVTITLPNDLNPHFDIKTNFGDIKNNTTIKLNLVDNDHTNKHYINNSSDKNVKIKVNNEFGKITLQ